jgi:hypothetical protein
LPEQGKGKKKKHPERVHSNFHWCFHETWKLQVSQTRTSFVMEGTVPYFQTYPSPAVTIYGSSIVQLNVDGLHGQEILRFLVTRSRQWTFTQATWIQTTHSCLFLK